MSYGKFSLLEDSGLFLSEFGYRKANHFGADSQPTVTGSLSSSTRIPGL